ncbi:hypothetical protein [Piscinibacter koreensis]|uniref:Uncharacterized protein n=1 Tax=Piscinibacter koreensis TaxID=2742824 RepID=A0A7Y6TY04_9BURK|nr:hypothetical protein [Schlegelella koreensis]NUZ07596.1 hypothetical protein [Schlegelella koreensis]
MDSKNLPRWSLQELAAPAMNEVSRDRWGEPAPNSLSTTASRQLPYSRLVTNSAIATVGQGTARAAREGPGVDSSGPATSLFAVKVSMAA